MRRFAFMSPSVLTGILISAAVVALAAWDTREDYRNTVKGADELITNLSRSGMEQLRGRLSSVDILLEEMESRLRITPPAEYPMLAKDLTMRAQWIGSVRVIFATDKNGIITFSNEPSLIGYDTSGREYFKAMEFWPEDLSYFGDPFVAATGVKIVNITRARLNDLGDFDGVVSATMLPSSFDPVTRSITAADLGGAAVLISRNQIVIHRTPSEGDISGMSLKNADGLKRHLASGLNLTVQRVISPIDGKLRRAAYRTDPLSGLHVAVSVEIDKMLAPFRTRAIAHWIVVGLILVMTIFLTRQLHTRERDLVKSQRLLADANEDLGAAVDSRTKELSDAVRELTFLKTALDQHAIVSITDPKGDIIYANQRFCDISGYDQSELLGQNHRILNSKEHAPAFFQDLWRTIARGQIWHGLIKNRNKNGSHYWVRATIVPFLDDRGKPIRYVAIRTDVTDQIAKEQMLESQRNELQRTIEDLDDARMRIEQQVVTQIELSEQLSVARDQADAANKAKSAFLATMSHEIRTPMTGVMGFADLLLEDRLPAVSREKIFKIKDSTRALLKIINDILDVSKMDAGKLEIEYLDFNLRTQIDDVVALFSEKRKGSRAKAIEINVKLSDDFPVGINADPTRLRQVLINLVGNAVKFTEGGSVTISGSMTQNGVQPFVRIAVTDTGIGMSPQTVDGLFKDFAQADASISRRFEGTGLGLAICKRLVELMGGRIAAESTLGVGSTFHFTLPFTPATTDVTGQGAAWAGSNLNYRAQRPLRILVAEDNVLNQQVIGACLAAFGHDSVFANNGALALEAHRCGDYDLILMDIRMPEMSGPDATRAIRQLKDGKGQTPIIALTADAMAEHRAGYFEAGMNGVATKPIDRAELALTINEVMGEAIHIAVPVAAEPPPAERDASNDTENSAAVADFLKQLGLPANG